MATATIQNRSIHSKILDNLTGSPMISRVQKRTSREARKQHGSTPVFLGCANTRKRLTNSLRAQGASCYELSKHCTSILLPRLSALCDRLRSPHWHASKNRSRPHDRQVARCKLTPTRIQSLQAGLAMRVIRLLYRWVPIAAECVLVFCYPPDNEH